MPIHFAVLVGLVFGLWGMLGSKVNGGVWTAPIVMSFTAIMAFWLGRRNLATIPTTSALFWLTVAGVLNGWACCKFGAILASLGDRAGPFGALVSIFIAASALVWAFLFFGTVPNLRQIVGILLGAAAIWLLASK